mgnify:CR=1 FL=1
MILKWTVEDERREKPKEQWIDEYDKQNLGGKLL